MENKRIVAWILLFIGLIGMFPLLWNVSDIIYAILLIGFVLGSFFAMGLSYLFANPKNKCLKVETDEGDKE